MMRILWICIVLFCASNALATLHTVNVNSLSFSPANITIQQGDTVRWVKTAGVHNVAEVSPTPVFRSGEPTGSAFTYTFVFAAPLVGTYNYRCEVHAASGMIGSVTVEAPAPCLPAENVVIAWEADDQVALHWVAPQLGHYDVYGTSDATLVTPPPSAGWSLVAGEDVPAPGLASTTLSSLSAQQFLVVVHSCSP
ncbi:hypothetical protein KJZ99_10510 [bacterium]|nr:hypothetical protein [bacterium]